MGREGTGFLGRSPIPALFQIAGMGLILSVGIPTRECLAAPYPPISSTHDLLIVNRRFVSQIVFESVEERHFLTLILTHGPAYWAFRATPHPLHFACNSPKQCYAEAKRLDRHLRSGWNVGLSIDGSFIREIVYLSPESEQDRAGFSEVMF